MGNVHRTESRIAMRELLLKHYGRGNLTIQQYRVLLGLVNSGNENGARKGLSKIMGRKREKGMR